MVLYAENYALGECFKRVCGDDEKSERRTKRLHFAESERLSGLEGSQCNILPCLCRHRLPDKGPTTPQKYEPTAMDFWLVECVRVRST